MVDFWTKLIWDMDFFWDMEFLSEKNLTTIVWFMMML